MSKKKDLNRQELNERQFDMEKNDFERDESTRDMTRDEEDLGDAGFMRHEDGLEEDEESMHNPNVEKSRGMKERERDNIE